ncbi:MAG: hypothetical protein JNM00_10645 [Flavobacteriales bacterium]|nr:hypothetical protein [Flavobacteriales bacterium]
MKWLALLCLPLLAWPDTMPTRAVDVTFDPIGNGYLIYPTWVEKYDPSGRLLFRTGDLNFGAISSFEATDPLKPFIFFRDQGILCPLDNTMSLQGQPLFLYSADFSQIDCVARAVDGNYWCWDGLRNELVKVDGNLQRITASGNMAVMLSTEIHPYQLVAVGNHVCAADSVNGLLIFDFMGNFRSRTLLPSGSRLQPDDRTLLIFSDAGVQRLDPSQPALPAEMPRKLVNARKTVYHNHRLYWLTGDALVSEPQ